MPRIHEEPQRCRVCRTPTHHVDRKGQPFCACCVLDRKPLNPVDAAWKPDALKPLTFGTDDSDEPEEIL